MSSAVTSVVALLMICGFWVQIRANLIHSDLFITYPIIIHIKHPFKAFKTNLAQYVVNKLVLNEYNTV